MRLQIGRISFFILMQDSFDIYQNTSIHMCNYIFTYVK